MRGGAHPNGLVIQAADRRQTIEEDAVDATGRVDHVGIATARDETFAQIKHVPPGAAAGRAAPMEMQSREIVATS